MKRQRRDQQPAGRQAVGQRQERDEADPQSHLGQRRQKADQAGRQVDRDADLNEQRLDVVSIRDRGGGDRGQHGHGPVREVVGGHGAGPHLAPLGRGIEHRPSVAHVEPPRSVHAVVPVEPSQLMGDEPT